MSCRRKNFVDSLARGLRVLQAFSPEETHLTLTRLAERVELSVPVVQRHANTLVQLGFMKRNKYKEYFLGPKVLSLGFSFLSGSQLKNLAEGILAELCDRVNRNVNLGILEGADVIYMARKESRTFIKLDLHVGSKMPAYCTAMGKVLLASLRDSELIKTIKSMTFRRVTEFTITEPNMLWDNLMEVRKRGYSICDRELSMDLYSLAVPIIDGEGKVLAAVNISLIAGEDQGEVFEKMFNSLICVGEELSKSLGYRGKYPFVGPY